MGASSPVRCTVSRYGLVKVRSGTFVTPATKRVPVSILLCVRWGVMSEAGNRLGHEPADELAPYVGTSSSFEEFYRDSYPELVRLLTALTGRPAVGHELTQDVMLKAWSSWETVRKLERPDLWVRRVALNRAISQRRRSLVELRYLARLRRSPIANDAPPLDGQVWAALAGLPRRQAAALLLWSVFGHTLAEIGVLLGCSEETARTHLRRARTRLREELDHV